jgi:isocitrate lyase
MERFEGIKRPYSGEQIKKLQGSFKEDYTYSKYISTKLWNLLNKEAFVPALGAITGNQAMQMKKAGLNAIYCSGWQVAADNNEAGSMYPDQSLYPSNSVPVLVKKINNALKRADQIDHMEGKQSDWWLPIVADAEAGFGGPLNAFELMKSMIEAGAAGVHFEDQLSSAKRCGHMSGKVLVPGSHFVQTLVAARLAADVLEVPTVLVARTDANSAKLLTSDIDESDRKFILPGRTPEGFYNVTGGLDMAIDRGLQYAPYADLLWCETSEPDLKEAARFAESIHDVYPYKLLSYNLSPSFNWKKKLDDVTIAKFQRELGAMGYKFQFVTLAGFHSLNMSMFKLAYDYKDIGMTAYASLQEKEFAHEVFGYTAHKHQKEVGTNYFDLVSETIGSSLLAQSESTETEQF